MIEPLGISLVSSGNEMIDPLGISLAPSGNEDCNVTYHPLGISLESLFKNDVGDKTQKSSSIYDFDRFIMLIIVNVLNWSFAIYGAVTEPGDFASFLLGIFIGNLLLYCTFYIIMKLRYRERIHPLAIVCIICACIVWGAALYFFFFHLTSWQLTPSGSRAGNQKCIVLDFYDAHDVWHFLSATSMFFSFLILLTLDDDLFSIRRDKIPVF